MGFLWPIYAAWRTGVMQIFFLFFFVAAQVLCFKGVDKQWHLLRKSSSSVPFSCFALEWLPECNGSCGRCIEHAHMCPCSRPSQTAQSFQGQHDTQALPDNRWVLYSFASCYERKCCLVTIELVHVIESINCMTMTISTNILIATQS